MSRARGFSVVELLVTIAVMAGVAAMVLFSYSTFNRQIAMNRAARALAFGLREAQSRSVNVNQVECILAPCFPENFGLHMDTTAGNDGQFVLFTDRNNDKKYNSSGTCGGARDECVTTSLFTNGIHIQDLKRPPPCGSENIFDILFYRPDPTIEIYNGSSVDLGECPAGTPVNGPFRIFVVPKNETSCTVPGVCKVVRIWLTGQISIEQ